MVNSPEVPPREEDQSRSTENRGPRENRHNGVIMASQNVEIAEKGYAAYAAGDIETALNDFDDNIEWSIPGNSTLGGTYRGKGEFMQFLGKLAEKSFTTTPERILGDGDDVIVITKVTAGGESALQADALTYRTGKLVKAVTIGDTAMFEKVYGKK
jgi:ketosteroid isomerase-like protein